MTKNANAVESDALTYPLGAVARLTGLSPDVLRAWERRYQVVTPLRTPGGTRRYQNGDIERLRLLKAAVDAGHRIGEMAALPPAELERRVRRDEPTGASTLHLVMRALERLDIEEAERLTSLQLSALGAGRFAREFAAPLAEALGRGWRERRLRVASEHMGTALLRSLLGASLRPSLASAHCPPIVFCTLPGEHHELGLLIAALTALGAGGNPLYLGPHLPVEEIVGAVEIRNAAAVALSIIYPPDPKARGHLEALRAALPRATRVWLGGAGAPLVEAPAGVERIGSMEQFEQEVALASIRRR